MPALENKKKAAQAEKDQEQSSLVRARTLAEAYGVAYTDIDKKEEILSKVEAAKSAGIQPTGLSDELMDEMGAKVVPPPAKKASVLPGKAKRTAEAETEDIEITSPDQLKASQEIGKLIGWGGWFVEVKDDKGNVVDEVPAKNKTTGIYEFIPGAKGIMRVALSILMAFFFSTSAFAAVAVTDESVLGVSRWSVDSSGHFTPGADSTYKIGASGNEVSEIYADKVFIGGGATRIGLPTTLTTNAVDVVNSVWGVSNGINFEGATADAFELTITVGDPTVDQTLTIPATAGATGTFNLGGATVVITAGASPTLTIPLAVNFIATDTIITDNQDQTITFSSGGTLGQQATIIFITDAAGAADEVITFQTTLVNSTGTLTLANLVSNRYSVRFQSDGTVWNEVSRTGAQT